VLSPEVDSDPISFNPATDTRNRLQLDDETQSSINAAGQYQKARRTPRPLILWEMMDNIRSKPIRKQRNEDDDDDKDKDLTRQPSRQSPFVSPRLRPLGSRMHEYIRGPHHRALTVKLRTTQKFHGCVACRDYQLSLLSNDGPSTIVFPSESADVLFRL
jgi:hypothetical protein